MSPLDSKLILDALDKLFAEQNAKWDRRFADMDAAWDRLLAPRGRAQVAGEQRDAAAEPRVEQPAHDPEERELDLSAFGSAQIRNECGLSSIVPVAPLDVVHKPATVSDATSTDGCIGSDLHRTHPIDFDRLSILPDVILRDIVSRLPIKEAARTAVLSRRWRPLCAASSVSLVHSNPVLLRRFPRFPKGAIYDNDGVCVDTAADELFRLTNQAGKPTIVREKVPIEANLVFLAVQIKQAAIGSAHAPSTRCRGRGPRRRRRPPRLLVCGRRPRLRSRALMPQPGAVHHRVRAPPRRLQGRARGFRRDALPQPRRAVRLRHRQRRAAHTREGGVRSRPQAPQQAEEEDAEHHPASQQRQQPDPADARLAGLVHPSPWPLEVREVNKHFIRSCALRPDPEAGDALRPECPHEVCNISGVAFDLRDVDTNHRFIGSLDAFVRGAPGLVLLPPPRDAASPIPFAPREAFPLVLATAVRKSGADSVPAARVFDKMWSYHSVQEFWHEHYLEEAKHDEAIGSDFRFLNIPMLISFLVASGGTNIAHGLKKAAIVLLADGHHVQIHTFSFGSDHDSAALCAISEFSSGTLPFIDAEGSTQDRFAQCIGGFLSVVVTEMQLGTECVDIGMLLTSIKSGGYASQVAGNGRGGSDSIGRTCKLTIAVEIVWTVWELKLESRQLKCGVSADHIPILSGLCTGYDLCNMSSSSIWDPGGPLFLLHHLTVTRVKMLIVSCCILILLGSMCQMLIQSMQFHDDVFCRILCLDSYGSGMYYNCRVYAGFKVICQLPALMIATYFVQLKRGGLTQFDSHSLFHEFGINCWGLLAERKPVSYMVLTLYIFRQHTVLLKHQSFSPDALLGSHQISFPEILIWAWSSWIFLLSTQVDLYIWCSRNSEFGARHEQLLLMWLVHLTTGIHVLYSWSLSPQHIEAWFRWENWGEKHCIRIPEAFRLYL